MAWHVDSPLFVLLLPTLLVGILTVVITLRKVAAQKRAGKLPPGPRGLPIIGHLHLLGEAPHQSLYKLSKVHGPLMSLRLGSISVVVASSPEMARQILQTHDLAFADRMPTAAANHIFGGCMDIAFSPPNTYWKLVRRLCATKLFSSKALLNYKPVRAEEIGTLMRSVLADSIDTSKMMDGDATPQEIRPKLKEATNNIITRMMVGKKFRELGEMSRQLEGSSKASIVELLGEMNEELGKFNVGDFLPWLAWMDLQGCQRRSQRLAADLRAAFEGVVQARRQASERPLADFLDVLLEASTSSTPLNIMAILLDLFAGGTETTALTVEWALAELLSNPEELRIVQEEIDEVVGRTRVIEEDDIEHLPYLLACVKETMRLHPMFPMLVPHKNNQECEILDFHIPANTQTYVNVWAIGRDSEFWENPTKFSPKRFLGTTSTSMVDVQGQHFELLPFGSGRRMCPGWKLGLQTVHIILASFLQGFEWSVPPCKHLDMSESFHLSISLTTPLLAYTSPRLSQELYNPL